MNKAKRVVQRGFTLIELLIVVVIVAILAAIVIPQFGNTSVEARESTLDANLAAVRTAIELYRIQHNNVAPGAATSTDAAACAGNGGNVPGAANSEEAFKAQLTSPTNADGVACTVAGNGFIFGPYLKTRFPADPIRNSDAVVVQATGAPLAPAADTGGWMYDSMSGQFVMNSNANDSRGRVYSAH